MVNQALDELEHLSLAGPHYTSLRTRTHYALGNLAEARRLLTQSAQSQHPILLRLQVGWLADSARYEEVHEVASRIPRKTGLHNDLKTQAELDAMRGRLAEAVTHLRQLRDQASDKFHRSSRDLIGGCCTVRALPCTGRTVTWSRPWPS